MHTTSTVLWAPIINIVWKWSIHYALLSAMFHPLLSKTNQELYKKHFCYQSSYYKK